jgi:hypothetical protein
VTAKLECIRRPQTVCILQRPALSLPLLTRDVTPIAAAWLPPIGELGRVVENENKALRGSQAVTGGLKMTSENLPFADPPIGEEAIGGLCGRPVLARQRQARSHGPFQLFEQLVQPLGQTLICERAAGKLLIEPSRAFVRQVHGTPPYNRVPDKESCSIHPRQAAASPPLSRDVGN